MIPGTYAIQSLGEIVDAVLENGINFRIARKKIPFFLKALEFNGVIEYRITTKEENYFVISVNVSQRIADKIEESFESLTFDWLDEDALV